MRVMGVILLILIGGMSGAAFSGEFPLAQVEEPVLEGWKVGIFEIVLSVIALVFSRLLLVLTGYMKKRGIEGEAVERIKDGLARTQDIYIRELRESVGDRKLTKVEVAKANRLAYERAIALAKGPVLSLIKERGVDWVSSIAKQVLNRNKKPKGE